MRPNPNRGRVYRRCGCRDANGRQLGARCPQLANPRHGSWAFAVDMPSPDSRRKTMRRSGYDTRADARTALASVLECERAASTSSPRIKRSMSHSGGRPGVKPKVLAIRATIGISPDETSSGGVALD
jgi:hypothetical protein